MTVLKFVLFNRLVRSYLNSDYWFLRLNRRVKSLILEMWYTLAVFFPYLAMPLVLTMLLGEHLPTSFGWRALVTIIPFSLMMMALFNKDFFGGQSPVHRKLGYKVLDARSKETASKIQCMVRNLTGPIWPIEALFILVNPSRRLGDIIAGTILAEVSTSDPESILADIKEFRFDRDTIVTLLLSILSVTAFNILFDPRLKFW
ncbi:MAG TPA: hypothetical protein VD927_15325 [Chryseosolibacter sp.]|nr:hypothetical protein [Chryseosolibacter sp.]